MPKRIFLLFLTNWKIPFQDVPYSNNSKISSFYQLFFVILPLSPFIFYKKIKENIYGFVLFVYCLFNLVLDERSIPTIFAKLTCGGYVPRTTGDVILWFCRCVIEFMVHRLFMESPSKNSNDGLVRALGLNVVLYFFVLYTGNLRLYVTRMDIIGVLVVATVLLLLILNVGARYLSLSIRNHYGFWCLC